MSKTLRSLFFNRVKEKLYSYLKMGVLKETNPAFVYGFINEIIEEKMPEIIAYLSNNMITLEKIEDGADFIVKNIIIPYIKKARVE